MGTKVHEVMTDRPRVVTPETTVSEAAQLMKTDDIGSLPILDGEQLAGMVTDRDIVIRAVAEGKDPRGMPVREVASRELVTVNADEELSSALQLMASQQVRRLPVVDDNGRLVGILAQADIAVEAKEKDVGEMVEEISKSPTGPRCRFRSRPSETPLVASKGRRRERTHALIFASYRHPCRGHDRDERCYRWVGSVRSVHVVFRGQVSNPILALRGEGKNEDAKSRPGRRSPSALVGSLL